MPKKKSYITVTDQFCGAGGSSLGAKQAFPELEISLALNHWDLAIETHNTNFPDTLHDCTDVSACDPRRYPSTDILITSPECTNHSLAKGKKTKNLNQEELFDAYKKGKLDPAAERSRATMWDVPRFAEYHDYNIIIVENVVDARRWVMWKAWLQAMHLLGYEHECVYLNSMFCWPTPQSRDRMYVVFWKNGNHKPDLDFKPLGYCSSCCKDVNAVQSWKNPNKRWGKYRFQYVYCCPNCANELTPYYYAAFNCIDWSIPGTRIGDRKRPLAKKTIVRIEYGKEKHWNEPSIITTRYTSGIGHRVKPTTSEPLPTQPGDHSHALFTPFMIKTDHMQVKGDFSKSVQDPTYTQTSKANLGFVMPFITTNRGASKTHRADKPLTTQSQMINHGLVLPFVVENKGNSKSRGIEEPASSFTTRDFHGFVMPPFICEMNRTGKAREIDQPISTILAGGNHHALVTDQSLNSFLTAYYGGSNVSSHITDPTSTISTKERLALVSPGKSIRTEDCYYRMIKPHEVQAGMAFPEDYVILGTGAQKVKQCGNAVTPPAMEWLVQQCVNSLN